MQLYLHASQSILVVREFLVAFLFFLLQFLWSLEQGIFFLMVTLVIMSDGDKLKKDS